MKITDCDWKSGKKYKINCWDPDCYLYFDDFGYENYTLRNDMGTVYRLSCDEILSENWVEYIESKLKVQIQNDKLKKLYYYVESISTSLIPLNDLLELIVEIDKK